MSQDNQRRLISVFCVTLAVVVFAAFAGRHSHAQQRPAAVAFEYVGLSTTVCRIDRDSGAMWVLKSLEDPRNTVQGTPAARSWRWVKVNLAAENTSSPRLIPSQLPGTDKPAGGN